MEEDIKNLEEIINLCEEEINNNDKNITAILDLEDLKSLKNLLTRYKQLEEENEKLNQLKEKHNVRINDLCALVDNFAYNSIPVSLVKEKIEELDKQIEEFSQNIKDSTREEKIFWKRQRAELVGARNILISLLGKEK